jgi:hypothetical protein
MYVHTYDKLIFIAGVKEPEMAISAAFSQGHSFLSSQKLERKYGRVNRYLWPI